MRIALALLAMMLPTAAGAVDVGQSYASARAELIADGWVPVKSKEDPSERCFAREEICERYAETEECAPTGSAACLFTFSRRGKALSVTTENEMIDDLVVTGWK